jgi:hypothetical protein
MLSEFCMNKKIKNLIITSSLVFGLVLFLMPVVKAATLRDAFQGQLSTVGTGSGFNVGQRNVEPIIGTLISVALSFLGVIFLILMIYGGYMWMTAAGNEEKAKKARALIQAAVLGLIVVVGAYAITVFVMARISKDLIPSDGSTATNGAYNGTNKSNSTGIDTGCCLSKSTTLGDKCFDGETSASCATKASSQWFSNESCTDVPACLFGCCVVDNPPPLLPTYVETPSEAVCTGTYTSATFYLGVPCFPHPDGL